MAIQTVFTVRHKCGHTEDVDLSSRPAVKRKSLAVWLAKKDCRKCQGVSDEWREERQEQIVAFEEASQLAELSGTEKMQSYGRDVRFQLLSAAYEEFVQAGGMSEEDFETRYVAPARIIVAARFWLDAKDTETEDLEEIILSARAVAGYVCENPA